MDTIIEAIQKSILLKQHLVSDLALLQCILDVSHEIVAAFQRDGKVLFCGNGGSAADAQHLAAELSGRFYQDRAPLFAEALHVNTSYLTAVANDYSFDEVFERLVRAKGRTGDVLVGITTSGHSQNIIRACRCASSMNMTTIGLTGADGGPMEECCRFLLKVPSRNTARIQEAHILIGHIICELVERGLFPPQ